MLERVVTSLFNKYLGPYVENLDGTQLKLRLFTGKVSLKNLVVRPDAISKLLDLPIRVVAGTIGSINADIPLTALRSKPIIVQIDEVYLSLAPDFDGKPLHHMVLAATKAKLEALKDIEMHFVKAQMGTNSALSRMGTGKASQDDAQILEGLLATAIANLQLRITRVHVRYEHPLRIFQPRPTAPHKIRSMGLGLSIAEICISTTNDKWVVEYVRSGDSIYKLATLQGVAVYLDTMESTVRDSVVSALMLQSQLNALSGNTPATAERKAAIRAKLDKALRHQSTCLFDFSNIFHRQFAEKQIDVSFPGGGSDSGSASGKAKAPIAYLLKPVSLSLKANIPLGYPLNKPKADCSISIGSIELQLIDKQCSMALKILTDHAYSWERRSLQLPTQMFWTELSADGMMSDGDSDEDSAAAHVNLKPEPVSTKQRWRRALLALRQKFRATRRERSRQSFLREISVEYARLYLRRLAATQGWGLPSLMPAERRRYAEIEADGRLTFEDILALRRSAEMWSRTQLSMPLVDIAKRRDDDVRYYASQLNLESEPTLPASAVARTKSSKITEAPSKPQAGGLWSRLFSSKTTADTGATSAASRSTGEDDINAALASVTAEEISKIYEGLGCDYDAATGDIKAKAGSDVSAALAEAARVANSGLPMDYVWLRLNASIDNIVIAFVECALAGTVRLPRGTEPFIAGSTFSTASLRMVSRMLIERTALGYDQRAVSSSFGIDIGDVHVIDCGGVAENSGDARGIRASMARKASKFTELAYRYVLFSDHSQGNSTKHGRSQSSFAIEADDADVPTEDSICEEIDLGILEGGASQASGGGSLSINPVRSGWLSLRVVDNPSSSVFSQGDAAPSQSRPSSTSIRKTPLALYEDDSDASDDDGALSAAIRGSSSGRQSNTAAQIDQPSSSRLRIRLAARPLVFVWSPPWVKRVRCWWNVVDDVKSADSELLGGSVANNSSTAVVLDMIAQYLQALVRDASMALEATVLSEKTALDLRACFAAPVIVVPQKATVAASERAERVSTSGSHLLVIDLGSVAISTRAATHAGRMSSTPNVAAIEAHHDKFRAPENVIANVASQKSRLFDRYSVIASGLSLMICQRTILDVDETYDASRHSRFNGSGEIVVLQGLLQAPGRRTAGKSSRFAAVSAAEAVARGQLLAETDPWGPAVQGPPRVAWIRESAHYLLRDCRFSGTIFIANGIAQDISESGFSTPQLYAQVHATEVAVLLTTGDIVNVANICLAASAPLSSSTKIEPIAANKPGPAAVAAAALRSNGIFAHIEAPFDMVSPGYFAFCNPSDELHGLAVADILDKHRERDRSSTAAQPGVGSPSRSIGVGMLLEVRFHKLSLRLGHGGDWTQAAVESASPTFDLIVDAEHMHFYASTFDDGVWQIAGGAGNVLAFAAGGNVPRALMVEVGLRLRASGNSGKAPETEDTMSTLSLTGMQVCLVRRNKKLLARADQTISYRLNSPDMARAHPVTTPSSASYSSILQELKPDASYLFSPFSMQVLLAQTNTLSTKDTKVLVRLGSLILSLSPYDAVMLASLSQALQVGLTSVTEQLAEGLAEYLQHTAGGDADRDEDHDLRSSPAGVEDGLALDVDDENVAAAARFLSYSTNNLRRVAEEKVHKAAVSVVSAASQYTEKVDEDVQVEANAKFLDVVTKSKTPAAIDLFELRVVCDRVQMTLFTDASTRDLQMAYSDDTRYRTQVMRAAVHQVALRATPASLKLSSKASVYYFNDAVLSWEPILEPWDFLVNVSATKGDDGADNSIIRAACVASSPLSITVSSAFLASLPVVHRALESIAYARAATIRNAQKADKLKAPHEPSKDTLVADRTTDMQTASAFAPFLLLNETGAAVQVWRPSRGAVMGASRSAGTPSLVAVQPGGKMPISAAFLALREQDDASDGEDDVVALPKSSTQSLISADSAPLRADAFRVDIAHQLQRDIPAPDADPTLDDTYGDGTDSFAYVTTAHKAAAQHEQAAASDILSKTVVVAVNIQVAGYRPLMRQPINRVGVSHVVLTPLSPGQTEYRGCRVLPAMSATRASGTQLASSVAEAWQRLQPPSGGIIALPPMYLELSVEKGEGGCKVIRLRSTVHIHNSTRIPLVVRLVPTSCRPSSEGDTAPTAALADGLDEKLSLLRQNVDRFHGASEPSATETRTQKSLFEAKSKDEKLSGRGAGSVIFSCCEAAAIRLPLDRVIPPGGSWRLPVPYAIASKVYFRPAMQINPDKKSESAIPLCSEQDDCAVTIPTSTGADPAMDAVSTRDLDAATDETGSASFLEREQIHFMPDTRYTWSQFEDVGVDAAAFIAATSTGEESSSGVFGLVNPFRKKKADVTAKSTEEIDDAMFEDGLDVIELSRSGREKVFQGLLSNGSLGSGTVGSQADGSSDVVAKQRNDIKSLIAVCGSNRASSETRHDASGDEAADDDPTVHGVLQSRVLSSAYFYIASRVELVNLTNVDVVSIDRATGSQAPLEEMRESCGSTVNLVVRAPIEVQNSLGCSVEYDIGVPRFIYERIVSETGASETNGSTTTSKPSLFSFGRKKKEAAKPSVDAEGEILPDVYRITHGFLGPSQSISLLYAHPNAPPPPRNLEGRKASLSSSKSRYKQRLNIARYVRCLSIRFRTYGNGLGWSKWVGLWTPHDSTDREEQIGLLPALAGTLFLLPLLQVPSMTPRVSAFDLADATGAKTTLHCEHSLVSGASLLAEHRARKRDAESADARAGSVAADSATLSLTIFCRFWMCNATGLPLLYSTALERVSSALDTKNLRAVSIAAGQAQAVVEETFENQRFVMFKWSARLLPTDRPFWSNRYGTNREPIPPASFQLPSDEWTWEGDWSVDNSGDADAEGWQYHIDFPRSGDSGWSAHRNASHFVRRRRWVRRRSPPEGTTAARRALVDAFTRDVSTFDSPLLLTSADIHAQVMDEAPPTVSSLNANALLSLGIYMYGPADGTEDSCCVRILDSEWSQPFPLRTVGRPGIVTVMARPMKAEEGDVVLPQSCFELVVSARSCTQMSSNGMNAAIGQLFHRTMLVTMSPRFLVVNHLDAQIADQAQAADLPDTALGNLVPSPFTTAGVYFLQLAQASSFDEIGCTRCHRLAEQYLDRIAPRKLLGAETEYDIGAALWDKLDVTSRAFYLSDNEFECGAAHSTVPTVLTVPPGEHAPYYWPVVPGTADATSRVCIRVARLVMREDRAASARDSTTGNPLVVPVTEWSGAVELSQMAQVSLRLRANASTAARSLDCTSSDVFLRVSVGVDRVHGSATVTISTDAGLLPAAELVTQASAPHQAAGDDSARLYGGLGDVAPVFWSTGLGETDAGEMRERLQNYVSMTGLKIMQGLGLKSIPTQPVYRVDNHTLDAFEIFQKGVRDRDRGGLIVPPRSTVLLAWDEPEIPLELVHNVEGESGKVKSARSVLPGFLSAVKAGDTIKGEGTSRLLFTVKPLLIADDGLTDSIACDVDLLDMATAKSLVVPASRPQDVHHRRKDVTSQMNLESSQAAVIKYKQAVFMRTVQDARSWNVSKPSSTSDWPSVLNVRGDILCCNAELDQLGREIYLHGGTQVAAQPIAAPIVFENISAAYGWRTPLPSSSKPRSRVYSIDDVLAKVNASPRNPRKTEADTMRYGDIVMVRHDVVTNVGESDVPELQLSSIRTVPLYLTTHQNGKIVWVEREAAESVMLPLAGSSPSTMPACSAFIVVGGTIGQSVRMNSEGEAAPSRKPSMQDDDTADEELEDSARGSNRSFGLLPVHYADRLLEVAVATHAQLRQCRIPNLSKRKEHQEETAPAEDVSGRRVMSAMQRRRLAAMGVKVEAVADAADAGMPLPSTAMPTDLRVALATESLETLGSIVTKKVGEPSTFEDDFQPTEGVDTARAKAGWEWVRQVVYLPMLPASCQMNACPLSSQMLPNRVLAARVGFDGPTRVLTLHAVDMASSGKDQGPSPGGTIVRKDEAERSSFLSLFSFQLHLAIPEIYLSFVDASPLELLLVSLDDTLLTLSIGNPYWTAELIVDEIQVDNQLTGAAFPVVVSRGLSSAGQHRPFIQGSVVYHVPALSERASTMSTHNRAAVLNFPYVSVLVQETQISVEETLLRRIANAVPRAEEDEDIYSSDDEDDSVEIKQAHGRWKGKTLGKRGAFAALTDVRDSLAASILRSSGAKGKKGSPGMGTALTRAKIAYAPLRRRLAAISRSARHQASRDMARFRKFQNEAVAAVSRSAETVQSALTSKLAAHSRSRASSGGRTFEGVSGPSTSSLRSRAPKRSVDSELAEIAGPTRSSPVQRAQASSHLHGSRGQQHEHANEFEITDTSALLAEHVQWWWPARLQVKAQATSAAQPAQLYIQHMVINAVSAKVSFVRDPMCVQDASNSGTLTSPVSVVLNALGLMALSMHEVPIRLNGLEVVNAMASPDDLASRMSQHYVSAALAEVYKVVFASDILGNPVAVLGALGTGVRDFFVEPAQGIIQSPAAFGRGLLKGTGSLMKNTVVGLGVGVSSLAGSVSRGVATLTFDAEYIRDRAERAARRAQNRPAHLGEGLLQGGRELGRGLAQGLAGVVLDPLRGAEAEGATGFVKGVGKGIAGLVVKPVAGLLDMASRTTEGIVATAKTVGGDHHDVMVYYRRRHQRLMWGIDRVIIPTTPLQAVIVSIMRKALEVTADGEKSAFKTSANTPTATKGRSPRPDSSDTVITEMKDVMTGREALLRAALANITHSYMHHILWPHSPYLLIVTTRSIILARINRAASGAGEGNRMQQVVNLCWQTPVVTFAALSAATSASLKPAATSEGDAAALAASLQSSDVDGHVKRGRSNAAIGLMAGHVAYSHLLDSMAEMNAEATAAIEAGSAKAEELIVKRRARVSFSPLAVMKLDARVQAAFGSLSVKPADNAVFHLPQHIIDAMTKYVEPMPLHFSDAIATLANVRVDQSPKANVQSITLSLAYIDSAYSRYCKDRLAYIQVNPKVLSGAGEVERYSGKSPALETDDLLPVFHYIVSKASIDRPVLCAVLSNCWLLQEGASEGRDGFAVSMFKSACAWAAAQGV